MSWRPNPLGIYTDAFTLNWVIFRGYAFPPFALIGRCLQQVQNQRVEHLVLVAPVWPAQTWYPLLLELCVDFPLLATANANGSVDTTGQNPLPSLATPSWVVSLNCGYQTHGFSDQIRKILLAAWRQNTTSSYSSAWNIWPLVY